MCWTNSCLPPDQCREVTTCDDCLEDQVCVQYVTQMGPTYHCVEVPEICEEKPTCDCMGTSVCTGVFDACSDGEEMLSCSCPVC